MLLVALLGGLVVALAGCGGDDQTQQSVGAVQPQPSETNYLVVTMPEGTDGAVMLEAGRRHAGALPEGVGSIRSSRVHLLRLSSAEACDLSRFEGGDPQQASRIVTDNQIATLGQSAYIVVRLGQDFELMLCPTTEADDSEMKRHSGTGERFVSGLR